MDIAAIIAILKVVVAELPGAIATTQELVGLGTKLFATINGKDPTPEEIAALEVQIDADVAIALEPLPPAQPGDPDFTG